MQSHPVDQLGLARRPTPAFLHRVTGLELLKHAECPALNQRTTMRWTNRRDESRAGESEPILRHNTLRSGESREVGSPVHGLATEQLRITAKTTSQIG